MSRCENLFVHFRFATLLSRGRIFKCPFRAADETIFLCARVCHHDFSSSKAPPPLGLNTLQSSFSCLDFIGYTRKRSIILLIFTVIQMKYQVIKLINVGKYSACLVSTYISYIVSDFHYSFILELNYRKNLVGRILKFMFSR